MNSFSAREREFRLIPAIVEGYRRYPKIVSRWDLPYLRLIYVLSLLS